MTARLRDRITITPPIGPVPKSSVAAHLGSLLGEAGQRATELERAYDLSGWATSVRQYEMRENFFVLDQLDRLLTPPERARAAAGRALDVGAKHWSYLAALRSAVPALWDGIELDAHKRYRSLQTRASVARWRCRSHPGCRYLPGDVRTFDAADRYALVTWFLPFVTAEAHDLWGLPPEQFDPAATLAHVWSLVAPGGVLLVTNQGREEADRQQALFTATGIAAESFGEIPAVLSPFRRSRFAFVARRG